MRTCLTVPVAVFACLLLATACSKAADESAADKPKEGLEVGNKFLNYDTFSAETIDGDELNLSDYEGKLLFIDFWATWCSPCWPELPYLKAVDDTYPSDKFAIIGISLDGKISDLRAMVNELGLEYPQICDEKGWQSEHAKAFNIRSIPTNFLLDGDGLIIAKNLRGLAVDGSVARALGLDNPTVHYVETMEYLEASEDPDPDEAIAILDKALESDPERPEFHFLAAQVRLGAGDSEKAIAHYETGLEHKDTLPAFMPALFAYVNLGHIHLKNGDADKALETLDAAIEAINALGEAEKKQYTRFIPDLRKLKAQWAGGQG